MENYQVPFVNLKEQYSEIKKEIDSAISSVVESQHFILGDKVQEFEKKFAKYINSGFCIGTSSGTSALLIALKSLGIGKGDEVITVSNTFISTALAIDYAGAKPVFVDIGDDFLIDADALNDAITEKTKAILPVHLYGNLCDMKKIKEIAKKNNLQVIEDACQAHGAMMNGSRAGNFGDAGCFSFYPTKNLGGYGDSGCITTNNTNVDKKSRMLRNVGQAEKYYHPMKGFNDRMDELQAAVINVKLKHLDAWNRQRIEVAKKYDKGINNEKIVKPKFKADGSHVYHQYVIRAEKRDSLQKYLMENGIQTMIHYPLPIHLQEAYKEMAFGKGSLPKTEKYAGQILSLPIYPELTEEQIDNVIEKINGF